MCKPARTKFLVATEVKEKHRWSPNYHQWSMTLWWTIIIIDGGWTFLVDNQFCPLLLGKIYFQSFFLQYFQYFWCSFYGRWWYNTVINSGERKSHPWGWRRELCCPGNISKRLKYSYNIDIDTFTYIDTFILIHLKA